MLADSTIPFGVALSGAMLAGNEFPIEYSVEPRAEAPAQIELAPRADVILNQKTSGKEGHG
jgi:hypothetical protein